MTPLFSYSRRHGLSYLCPNVGHDTVEPHAPVLRDEELSGLQPVWWTPATRRPLSSPNLAGGVTPGLHQSTSSPSTWFVTLEFPHTHTLLCHMILLLLPLLDLEPLVYLHVLSSPSPVNSVPSTLDSAGAAAYCCSLVFLHEDGDKSGPLRAARTTTFGGAVLST